MPVVASMGGNAGTQTMTVAVRALATRELSSSNASRIIRRELLVGVLNGLCFALIMGMVAGVWFQIPGLGFVIALAAIVIASAIGLILSVPITTGIAALTVGPAKVASGPPKHSGAAVD